MCFIAEKERDKAQIHDYLRKGTCGIMSVDYKIKEIIHKTAHKR